MKKYSIIAILFLNSLVEADAQEFPSYGNVTTAELEMKECSFDKEANAVVLVDEANSNFNDEYNLVTTRHIRIKILKEKGIEYANIAIPFYRKDDFERVYDIQGMVINFGSNGSY